MKRRLAFVIEAGEATCASAPGKFCAYVRVSNFGSKWKCALFDLVRLREGESGSPHEGWLLRRPECLEVEAKSKEDACAG